VAAVPSIGRATRVDRPDVPGAAAAGDLYERYSGQILGYCLHQLGSREEAEDAVQTTFMNAFRGLQRGIVPELESAWLFKIAHNVCLSRRRSSWRRGKVEAPNNFEVLQEIIPGREPPVADELIRLQDVLEEMPENQRRAILLREWQGLTYREISDELGLSQAAVETLIFRARRALAQGLEQDADTWKKRLRRGADVGGAIACVKTLLGGGGAAAIKIGTTAALVATAAVTAATAPVVSKHSSTQHPRAARTAKPAASTPHVRSVVMAPPVTHGVRTASVATQTPTPSSRSHASAVAHTSPSVGPMIVVDPEEPMPAAPPAAQPPAAETQSAPALPEPEESAPLSPPTETEPPAVDPPAVDQPGPPPEGHGNKPDKPEKPDKPDNGHGKDHK
jgi:RNA polymerase sigma factor (sigma-70 family)